MGARALCGALALLVGLGGCGREEPKASNDLVPALPMNAAEAAAIEPAAEPAAAPTGPDFAAPEIIPAAYEGEWVRDRAECGSGRDPARMRIESRRIRFQQSEGRVLDASLLGERSLDLTLAVTCRGGARDEQLRLTVAADHETLVVDGVTLRRCHVRAL